MQSRPSRVFHMQVKKTYVICKKHIEKISLSHVKKRKKDTSCVNENYVSLVCVAVCVAVCVHTATNTMFSSTYVMCKRELRHIHTATHCNTLQHTASHCLRHVGKRTTSLSIYVCMYIYIRVGVPPPPILPSPPLPPHLIHSLAVAASDAGGGHTDDVWIYADDWNHNRRSVWECSPIA